MNYIEINKHFWSLEAISLFCRLLSLLNEKLNFRKRSSNPPLTYPSLRTPWNLSMDSQDGRWPQVKNGCSRSYIGQFIFPPLFNLLESHFWKGATLCTWCWDCIEMGNCIMRMFPISRLIPCDNLFADTADFLTPKCCYVITTSLCDSGTWIWCLLCQP